nr:MAG TPA: hypothetical protein [Caudoviricetes sp.]
MPAYTPTPLLITVTTVFYSIRIFLSRLASTYSATIYIYNFKMLITYLFFSLILRYIA